IRTLRLGLNDLKSGSVLVLDDFHGINNPEILESVAVLLRHESPLRLMLLSRSDPGAGVVPPENWRWPAGDPRCRAGVLRRCRTRPDRREICGREPEFRGTRWSRCARLARWLGAISGGLKALAVPEDVRS